jgi:hypothetical protein
MNSMPEKKILSVLAHPDDETFAWVERWPCTLNRVWKYTWCAPHAASWGY